MLPTTVESTVAWPSCSTLCGRVHGPREPTHDAMPACHLVVSVAPSRRNCRIGQLPGEVASPMESPARTRPTGASTPGFLYQCRQRRWCERRVGACNRHVWGGLALHLPLYLRDPRLRELGLHDARRRGLAVGRWRQHCAWVHPTNRQAVPAAAHRHNELGQIAMQLGRSEVRRLPAARTALVPAAPVRPQMRPTARVGASLQRGIREGGSPRAQSAHQLFRSRQRATDQRGEIGSRAVQLATRLVELRGEGGEPAREGAVLRLERRVAMAQFLRVERGAGRRWGSAGCSW